MGSNPSGRSIPPVLWNISSLLLMGSDPSLAPFVGESLGRSVVQVSCLRVYDEECARRKGVGASRRTTSALHCKAKKVSVACGSGGLLTNRTRWSDSTGLSSRFQSDWVAELAGIGNSGNRRWSLALAPGSSASTRRSPCASLTLPWGRRTTRAAFTAAGLALLTRAESRNRVTAGEVTPGARRTIPPLSAP